ncbi:hypothetical protein FOVG_15116 [Fusarium oxysporum f. sp. pisi HDV247]|uniref:Uncharacterized protein n=1 Tax=Fusarium oxysporum f. sp. pisi HDV247 TaxID=1080344 RepID=W9NSV4_FUSOX|nr:hypothetical protein FOVG_15116 [Fusarium oxysporum f. sp. pisi HDV247]
MKGEGAFAGFIILFGILQLLRDATVRARYAYGTIVGIAKGTEDIW